MGPRPYLVITTTVPAAAEASGAGHLPAGATRWQQRSAGVVEMAELAGERSAAASRHCAAAQDFRPARSTRAMVNLHLKPTIALGASSMGPTPPASSSGCSFSHRRRWMGQMGTAHASHTLRAWVERAISDSSLACAWLAVARTPRAVLVWRDFGERLCAATPTPFERGCCCCC